MSLHDMYFSSKNKNHIFNLIKDLVLKETSEDINQNSEYIDLYRFKYSLIFERSNSDNIIDLNKSLIDEIAPLFIDDINSKYSFEVKNEKNEYEKKTETKQEREYYINSNDRKGDSLNNYNYYLDLPKNITFLSLKEISIPIENNILFTNPIICVKLNDNNIYCQFKKTILFNNRKFNSYEPSSKIMIQNEKKININILTNTLATVKEKNDKVDIDKIKIISLKNKKYLCFKIKSDHNIDVNNSISLFENNKIKKTFIVTNKIGNNLLIQNEIIDFNNEYRYHILNTDLQNNIIFNVI